jgi:hypothetical protein
VTSESTAEAVVDMNSVNFWTLCTFPEQRFTSRMTYAQQLHCRSEDDPRPAVTDQAQNCNNWHVKHARVQRGGVYLLYLRSCAFKYRYILTCEKTTRRNNKERSAVTQRRSPIASHNKGGSAHA